MNFKETQAAISLPQKHYSKTYPHADYASPGSRRLFHLDELAMAGESREVRGSQIVGEVTIRDWRCGRTFDSLDKALAGGRDNWLLGGYIISRHGLVVTFLPKNSVRLQREASSYEQELEDADETTYLNRSEEFLNQIYHEHAVKLVLRGKFQVWFNGRGTSDVVICTPKHVQMLCIDGMRKTSQVTFPFSADDKVQQLIYS